MMQWRQRMEFCSMNQKSNLTRRIYWGALILENHFNFT